MRLSRRAWLAAAALAAACRKKPVTEATPPAPKEPFVRLVYALGPWPLDAASGREIAESFQRGQPPSAPSGLDFDDLATRCFEDRRTTGSVNLGRKDEKAKNFVLDFAAALYRIPDVHAALTNAPPEGECPADRLLHTRAPI